jgi:hypothetical protein
LAFEEHPSAKRIKDKRGKKAGKIKFIIRLIVPAPFFYEFFSEGSRYMVWGGS